MQRPLRHAWLFLTGAVLTAQAPAPPLQLDVVVNAAGPSMQLSRQSAADVFLLKRQYWSNRAPVVLVLQPGDAALHAAFCAKVLELPCDSIEQAELEKRYQGKLFARVLRATSAAEAAQLLLQNPSAVGYARRGAAPAGARVVLQP